MRWNEESWQPIAHTLGFSSEEEMLRHFYSVQMFSLREMSKILGYASFSVRRRLLLLHIPLRPRGGPNRAGIRKLKDLEEQRLYNTPPGKLAEECQVHISTVFAEKRLREKERKTDAFLSDHATAVATTDDTSS